ncbi:MAG: DUF1538 domain-containing protein [Arcobacter sp.]|uniref:DUF1538 domain-containing protein n=1 Tax=Arcobacter sp. TaxID=1872629 RepID=UPI002586F483|nr:DUF1538 domain-containing protein [Arcobacter sp.]MDD3008814.1 DUF1538 domain-containing protein [Arcobacter sp.]
MNELIRQFRHTFVESSLNLVPIILVVAFFYIFIFQTIPNDLFSIAFGFFIVVVGATFFLMGLEIGIFPLGNNLSSEFLEKKSIFWFALFGFSLGFGASIAEPAIISIASQAGSVTQGKLDPFILRVLIAFSVGMITAFGIMRTILGWSISNIIIIGYIFVLIVAFFAPAEILGLAFDSGAIATNVATVPLIVSLGIGITSAISGKSVLKDGFGFVALAVITPILIIMIYGIFALGIEMGTEVIKPVNEIEDNTHYQEGFTFLGILKDLFFTFLNLVPIIVTILIFQYLVIKKPLANINGVIFGLIFLVIGLYSFIVGIKLGLFPIGETIAKSLFEENNMMFIYLFSFLIGFATTMAEPALLATIKQADMMGEKRLNVTMFRILVALGIGIGIFIGTYRLINGYDIWTMITILYIFVIFLAILAPKEIVAFAFDLGGVSITVVTLPIITAFGIFLATNIEGRDPLMDGFGLIAFASVFPMITVMSYSIISNLKK